MPGNSILLVQSKGYQRRCLLYQQHQLWQIMKLKIVNQNDRGLIEPAYSCHQKKQRFQNSPNVWILTPVKSWRWSNHLLLLVRVLVMRQVAMASTMTMEPHQVTQQNCLVLAEVLQLQDARRFLVFKIVQPIQAKVVAIEMRTVIKERLGQLRWFPLLTSYNSEQVQVQKKQIVKSLCKSSKLWAEHVKEFLPHLSAIVKS